MPAILTTAFQFMCAHGGKAMPTRPFPKVMVGGQPVLAMDCTMTVAACPMAPPAAPGPCTMANWLPPTASKKVLVGGKPVLLASSAAMTVPNPGKLNVMPSPGKVEAT